MPHKALNQSHQHDMNVTMIKKTVHLYSQFVPEVNKCSYKNKQGGGLACATAKLLGIVTVDTDGITHVAVKLIPVSIVMARKMCYPLTSSLPVATSHDFSKEYTSS